MKFTLRPQRRLTARKGPAISLFPFLAVLICTMGALVPLLLAMMNTAHDQAEAAAVARAAEYAAKHNAELQTAREDVLWRIEQLKSSRVKTQAQLADARLELGHLEDHARRLRGKIEQYQNTVTDLEKIENADHEKHGQSEAELQQLRQQVGAARQQVDQARKDAAGRRSSYAVVPYEGPNQTRRRPIYLECLADAVVIQPEGIRLTVADFEGPMGPGNPLAAALRAAREHLLAERGFDPQAGEPYPLLLVRPKGIGAYYAAREAMKSWGCDFGYELVGDDWKLAYPSPNPRLADVVNQALDSARTNQARLIAAAPRQYGSRPRPTYRASPSGGFAAEDGDSDDDDGGYRPATPAGSIGRNAGGNGSYGGRGTGTAGDYNPYAAGPDRSGTAVPGGSGSGGQGNGGYGGRGTGTAGDYNPYAAGPDRSGTAVPGSGGTGSPSGGIASGDGPALVAPDGTRVGGGGGAGVSGGAASGSGNGYASGMGSMGNGYVGTGNGGGAGVAGGAASGSGNGYASGMGDGNTSGSGNGYAGTGNGGGIGSGTGGMGNGNAGNPGRGGAGDATAANPYVTMPERSENAAAGGGASAGAYGVAPSGSGQIASQRSGGSQNSGAAAERPEGYVVGQPAREAPAPTTPTPQSSAGTSQGRVLRPGEWEPTPEPPPKQPDEKKDDDKFGRKPPRSLAERRGEDWGLRNAARGVGVTRPIRVECYADRLVVVSDRGPSDNKVIPLGPRTSSSVDTFISAVWGRIEAWGMAGRGMYWRPVLQVSVAPNAEDRFADLSALLDGSGLAVKRR